MTTDIRTMCAERLAARCKNTEAAKQARRRERIRVSYGLFKWAISGAKKLPADEQRAALRTALVALERPYASGQELGISTLFQWAIKQTKKLPTTDKNEAWQKARAAVAAALAQVKS